MKNDRLKSCGHQRGAVLVVSLIMLAVLTLFVISMIKTAIIELKIGGVSQIAALNLAAAESAVDNFLVLNSGRFAPNWLGMGGLSGPVTGSMSYTPDANAYSALTSSVVIAAYQTSCGNQKAVGEDLRNNLQAVQFDVIATASGAGGVTVVHQGVQSLAPAGACP